MTAVRDFPGKALAFLDRVTAPVSVVAVTARA